jgi:hypothetical protein
MSYDKLVDDLKNNREISLDEVHSYYWNPQEHSVKNVSDEIRKRLKADIER